ncbi:reverse transcriptase [Senna tora]|uniref:Reverse transcriptase n=1 Tax=Senna tora TaxID=362788 RepID=A0A834W2D2_9FABA|nr:reverse transcriptase [Senna tora]
MANNSPIREMSWPESNPSHTQASSSDLSYSSDSSSANEPDFSIPRQGPRIVIPQEIIMEQHQFWQNCLVVVLFDDGHVKEEQLAEVPWAVQNKLLVLDHWQPNVILDEYRVVSFPLWVEFWGFPLEYYSTYVAEHVGEFVGEVVQVDFSYQGFRNLRYLRVRVNIDPSKPLLMGFYVLLDNGRANRRMVQHAVDEQRQRIKDNFGFSCFIDYESILFVNEAVAFRMSNSRRTTMIRIKKEGEQAKYVTSEFKPISYLRIKSSSSSESRPTNIIRVSDASLSDSDSSSNTPHSYSSPSQNQPTVRGQGMEDELVDIMDIDPLPVTTQEQLMVHDMGPHFLNIQAQQCQINDTFMDLQFNCQEQQHFAEASHGSPIPVSMTTTLVTSNNSLEALLCNEDPESFCFMQSSPAMQVPPYSVPYSQGNLNPLWSPQTLQFSELAQFLPSASTAVNEVANMQLLGHMENIPSPDQTQERSQEVHVPLEDEDYQPFILTHFFKSFIKISGLGFIWDDITEQLLQLRPNIQAQFGDSFTSWACTSANSTNLDTLMGWALVFIPAASGPFLACPLNWFYSFRVYTFLTEKWALFATVSLSAFYDCFDAFTPSPIKRKATSKQPVSFKKQKTYGRVLGKFQLIQARPLQKYPFKKRARFVMDLDPIEEETMLKVNTVARSLNSMGYDRYVGTNVKGRSGGTILAWNQATTCQFFEVSKHWIHTSAISREGTEFLFTCVYGHPTLSERVVLWDFFHQKASVINPPWLIFRNFNQISSSAEKLSITSSTAGANTPKDLMDNDALIDLHAQGNWYTWHNGRLGDAAKCRGVKRDLIVWNRTHFGHVQQQITNLNEELHLIQQSLVNFNYPPPNLLLREKQIRKDLEDKLAKEEILWAQKARQLWLVEGDRNTKYFHAIVKKRRMINHFTRIRDSEGEWTQDYSHMERLAVQYFCDVYNYPNKPQRENIDQFLNSLEADNQNCSSVRQVLDKYATMAGQVLNKDKSIVIFSPNTPRRFKRTLASILGANTSNKLGKYLGVKVDNRLNSAELFKELIEKVEHKLAGWKSRLLSKSGRLTLIKSVLQSTPIYQLSVKPIPNVYANRIDALSTNFYWGHQDNNSKMHLAPKQRLFSSKDNGGLGLRQTSLFNKALMAKQVWRIVNQPASIYSQWARAKYFNNDLEVLPKKTTQPSAIWKCIDKSGKENTKFQRAGQSNNFSRCFCKGGTQNGTLSALQAEGEEKKN